MVMSKYIYIVLVSFLCMSCMVGKKFSKPELDMPDKFDTSDKEKDSTSVATLPWEDIYTDTLLQKLIYSALENNNDMMIASARIKEMLSSQKATKADMYPQLGLSAYGQKEELNYGGNSLKQSPEFGAKFTLSWELDLWGSLRWTNQIAKSSYLQSVEGKYAVQMTIISEVAVNYYQLCALDQELNIVLQTLKAREEAVRLAKLRFEGGLTSETSYNQAQVELARTQTLVPELEKQIKLKESNLNLLLGNYQGKIERQFGLANIPLAKELPSGLPSSLLERRPDIKQANYKLMSANAKVGIAKTKFFPTIKLTANGGYESNELSNFIKSPAWFALGSLVQPLINMGKTRANVRAEQARYEQELYSYKNTVLKAFNEASNAIVTYNKVKEVKESVKVLEIAAVKYMEHANLQYINGVISYMDVLDAQRGLFSSQISLNNAILNEYLSVVYLYKALGGGY